MAKQHVFQDKGETKLTVLFCGDVYIYLLTAFVWFLATHQAILSVFPLQVFAISGSRLVLPTPWVAAASSPQRNVWSERGRVKSLQLTLQASSLVLVFTVSLRKSSFKCN